MIEKLQNKGKLSLWQYAGFVALLVFPIAEAALKLPLSTKRSLNLTAFDLTIIIAFISLLAHWFKRKCLFERLKSNAFAFLPSLLFLAAAAITYFSIDNNKSSSIPLFVKLFIQYAEYLLIAPVVFLALFKTEPNKTLSCISIGFIFTVLSCIIDNQFCENETAFSIGGLLLNRNNYAAYFALIMPFLVLSFPSICKKSMLTILTVASVAVGIWYVQTAWAFASVLFCLIVFLIYSISKKHSYAVIASSIILISLFGAMYNRKNVLADSVQVYVKYTDPVTEEVSAEHTMRYYRWAANINMIRGNLLKGVGLGQYGKRLKEYYSGISIPEGRTDVVQNYNIKANEPFSFGAVFVLLAEVGIIGFSLFIAVLASACICLLNHSEESWIKTTVLLSLFSIIIISLFANPLTRGCGGAISLILVLGISKKDR